MNANCGNKKKKKGTMKKILELNVILSRRNYSLDGPESRMERRLMQRHQQK